MLILLAHFIRSPHAKGFPEHDRSVGIALAQVSQEAVEYLDRADSVTRHDTSASRESLPLPDESHLAELPYPDVALPSQELGVVSPEWLIPQADYAPGGRAKLPTGVDRGKILAEDAAMRRASGPQGPTTQVSLFGSGMAEGRSFIFVVDRSQSMGRGGLGVLALANQEFQRALSMLEPVHQFQILAYNHDRVFFGDDDKLVPATDQNKQRVDKFMRGLAAFGATAHFMAIMSAVNRSPDVVFLLTDGGDPPLSDSELVQIRKRASGRTTIHCIQFSNRAWDGEETFLHRLSRENGGSYRYIDVSRLPER